jgi:hypothetical protein
MDTPPADIMLLVEAARADVIAKGLPAVYWFGDWMVAFSRYGNIRTLQLA